MNIHFNGYKVRYKFMDYHISPVIRSHNIRSVNIFINLDDLFHTLHRPLINNEFQVSGTNAHIELVSNVFNLIGHYKNWATKNNFRVNIYAVYSSAMHSFKNAMWVPMYRKKFFDINSEDNSNYFFINSALRNSYKVMHAISKYINGVYIIDSRYLEPASIPMYIASEIHPADWNILISRDTYDVQYCYQDKWMVFSPKGDNSNCLSRENMWNYLNFKERIYSDKERVDLHYDHGLYILAKAVVGDNYRNIPRLRRIGWKTLFKYLDKLEGERCLENDNRIMQEQGFIKLIKDNRLNSEQVNRHIYAIDARIQMNNMLDLDKSIVQSQIIDMQDYKNLNEMNRTIFHLYPINLNFLCTEVKTKTVQDIWGF